jgi:type IV fimbrial biogenesis protein FimT
MKREGGFSLVELMTVIVVLGVLLVMVLPSLSDWMVNQRIRNTADALLRGLQLARQEAVRRNQTMGFWLVSAPATSASKLDGSCALSSSSGAWVVSINDPVGKCDSSPSVTAEPFLVAKHAPGDGGGQDIAVAATQSDKSTAATSIQFSGLGRVSSGTPIARIDVTKSGGDSANYRSLCIEVSGVGLVRMCDPALTDNADPRACLAACK